jgi:hypothetical protein
MRAFRACFGDRTEGTDFLRRLADDDDLAVIAEIDSADERPKQGIADRQADRSEQRIKISFGRNGLTDTTSCSASAPIEWL